MFYKGQRDFVAFLTLAPSASIWYLISLESHNLLTLFFVIHYEFITGLTRVTIGANITLTKQYLYI